MFGMVLATGIRILSRCNYTTNRYNLYIVAISTGVGMTPTLSHDFFSRLPAVLQPLLHSGIMLATFSAVVLNLFSMATTTIPDWYRNPSRIKT